MFPGVTTRKCCSCGNINNSMLVCSKCKVFAYCNQHCQRSHWSIHKKCCVIMERVPPPPEDITFSVSIKDYPDIDERYKYMLIFPQGDAPLNSPEAFLDCTHGIKSEDMATKFLDSIIDSWNSDTAPPLDAFESLSALYGIGPSMRRVGAVGYTPEYDGQHRLHLLLGSNEFDGGGMNRVEFDGGGVNRVAQYFASRPDETLLGPVVIIATRCTPEGLEVPVHFSRREVITQAIYSFGCHFAGEEVVESKRVFFDRLYKKTLLPAGVNIVGR